jgi:hypothetical protein
MMHMSQDNGNSGYKLRKDKTTRGVVKIGHGLGMEGPEMLSVGV